MESSSECLNPTQLLPFFEQLNCQGKLVIAFSGGGDSTALLYAMTHIRSQLNADLAAIHVHHGRDPNADHWSEHCAVQCAALGVPLSVIRLPAVLPDMGGPEATLRAARYEALENAMAPGDVICTAHHQEDQAETLLLNLLRGSGVDGLAGMPIQRPMGPGRLARPLLDAPQNTLKTFLQQHHAQWIEDPSNRDISLDRNRLRKEILPQIRQRWPAADRNLARSARLCGEASAALAESGKQELTRRRLSAGVLDVAGIRQQSPRLKLVIRAWLNTERSAPMPHDPLKTLVAQLADARPDSAVAVSWSGHHLRYYADKLWLDSPDADPLPLMNWPGSKQIRLDGPAGTLAFQPPISKADALQVGSRQTGDKVRAAPNRPRLPLNDWLHAHGVPPWLRDGVPIVRRNEEILAVGEQVISATLLKELAETGSILKWVPEDRHLNWLCQECMTPQQRLK